VDPTSLKLILIAALLFVGALHLLPPIVQQSLDILKRILEEFAAFVKWFRTWRRDLWPRGSPRIPTRR
jgi:hypothetical protein